MLLLRHGILFFEGQDWVGSHDDWLPRQRFDLLLAKAAFDETYKSVTTINARPDRSDPSSPVFRSRRPNSQFVYWLQRELLDCDRGRPSGSSRPRYSSGSRAGTTPTPALSDRDAATPRVRSPSHHCRQGGIIQPTNTVRETGQAPSTSVELIGNR